MKYKIVIHNCGWDHVVLMKRDLSTNCTNIPPAPYRKDYIFYFTLKSARFILKDRLEIFIREFKLESELNRQMIQIVNI